MADTNKRIGGVITFKVNGGQYPAKGNFTYNLGTPKREAVMGADGVHGYKETPQVAFIEGEVTDSYNTDLSDLSNTTNATILLELSNSKSIILRDAWFAGEGSAETEEGKISVRFEGVSGEESK